MTETTIQMRFADVDMLQHVNNVNQQHYFDLGKSDFFARALQMKPDWESEGLIMAAVSTVFKSQIRMEEPVSVTTRTARIGTKSFTLYQEIINADTKEVKTECTTTLVAFDFGKQQPIEIPETWKEKLAGEMA